ncbi:hypothetical protein N9L68_08045 [bacterium]|nr:hypothetical protein [bacterium]
MSTEVHRIVRCQGHRGPRGSHRTALPGDALVLLVGRFLMDMSTFVMMIMTKMLLMIKQRRQVSPASELRGEEYGEDSANLARIWRSGNLDMYKCMCLHVYLVPIRLRFGVCVLYVYL